MFKQQATRAAAAAAEPNSAFLRTTESICGEVKKEGEEKEVRRGFTTTLFGDRNQLIWRGMRIYTWSVGQRASVIPI